MFLFFFYVFGKLNWLFDQGALLKVIGLGLSGLDGPHLPIEILDPIIVVEIET